MSRPDVVAAGGWCAPNDLTYLTFELELRPEVWPVGLLEEDLAWLTQMIHAAEIDLVPLEGMLDLPLVSIKRGGIRFE